MAKTVNTKITWSPKKVAVKDIKHTPNNYKIKTDLGRERLQASLKAFGLAGTVVCNTDLTLIDGNSRLIEARENGEKFIHVSIPNRKLTPKEFQEMSAMFDYAKAGEVDVERIQKEIGTTQDFYKKWGMEVPLELLNKLGNNRPASDLDDLEYPDNGGTSSTAEVNDIKMVQLFFSEKQEAEFRKIEEKLKKKFKTESTTETVLKALKSIKL